MQFRISEDLRAGSVPERLGEILPRVLDKIVDRHPDVGGRQSGSLRQQLRPSCLLEVATQGLHPMDAEGDNGTDHRQGRHEDQRVMRLIGRFMANQ